MSSENLDNKLDKGFLESARLIEACVKSLCAEGGLSQNTAKSYMSDLMHFAKFVHFELKLPSVKRVAKSDIRAYIAHLRDLEMESSSISRKISSIRGLYKFMVSDGLLLKNPSSSIESPSGGRRLPKYAKDDYVSKIIDQCRADGGLKGVRDELMVQMLQTMGLRVSELVGLKWRSVVGVANSKDKVGFKMIPVMGKGSKERYVPLKSSVIELLTCYLDLLHDSSGSGGPDGLNGSGPNGPNGPNGPKGPSSGPKSLHRKGEGVNEFLFPSKSGSGHITRESVGLMLKQRAKEAGLDDSLISPHVLRHSFATNLCRNDVGVRFVQELLGHASISTTEIYLHTVEEQIVDFVEQNHPLARMSLGVKTKEATGSSVGPADDDDAAESNVGGIT